MCGYQCCPLGVHPDLQTCDKRKEAEERGKALELCLPPPHPCCTQQEAGHLESHLYYKHRDVYDMVEALNDWRQDEILKKKLSSHHGCVVCRDSFIGITCHLFDHKRKFRKTFHFCLRPFYEQHTAANIIEKVTRIMDEFGKVNFVCTDNDHNIKKASSRCWILVLSLQLGRRQKHYHGNSLAHTLELRFLKMFEFKDEEGVFYDVLNVEGKFRKV